MGQHGAVLGDIELGQGQGHGMGALGLWRGIQATHEEAWQAAGEDGRVEFKPDQQLLRFICYKQKYNSAYDLRIIES